MSVDFDLSEVFALAEDLGRTDRLLVETRAVVQKGALNLKKRLQQEASGLRSAPGLPRAITYETDMSAGGVEAVVGPVKGGAGSLAFFYFGNSKVGPQLPDPMIALSFEALATEEWLAKAAVNALG